MPRQGLDRGGVVDFDLKPVFNKYEDYFSEFDRFRISISSSPYQKRYGYTYDNCIKYSRRELQEMFFKPFLFDKKSMYNESEQRIGKRAGTLLYVIYTTCLEKIK